MAVLIPETNIYIRYFTNFYVKGYENIQKQFQMEKLGLKLKIDFSMVVLFQLMKILHVKFQKQVL